MKVYNFANPCSSETSADDNRKALKQLIGNLLQEGFSTYKGLGIDRSCDWPGEESVVVPGLSFDRTKLLGAEFGQNATVWAESDAVPQLILLRSLNRVKTHCPRAACIGRHPRTYLD